MSWDKIKDKSDGSLSCTEYTDHDGNVYKIYDMKIYPSTPNAYINQTDE
tara:strand:- start:507 stop:653 length:147 start_codon:yes stop_codon:yes gene_type:complete